LNGISNSQTIKQITKRKYTTRIPTLNTDIKTYSRKLIEKNLRKPNIPNNQNNSTNLNTQINAYTSEEKENHIIEDNVNQCTRYSTYSISNNNNSSSGGNKIDNDFRHKPISINIKSKEDTLSENSDIEGEKFENVYCIDNWTNIEKQLKSAKGFKVIILNWL